MSKTKNKSKKRRYHKQPQYTHDPIGTHLNRRPPKDPFNPQPREIGEKRGTGKGAIKIEIRNTIQYRLSAKGQVFTHHEDTPKTLTMTNKMAETFIREWIGLEDDDYCEVLNVRHTFVPDLPKLQTQSNITITHDHFHYHAR